MDSTIIFTDWAKEQMLNLNNPDSLRDTTYTMKNKYSGIRYQGGLIVGLNEHINLGFSYTHKSEITKKFRTLQDTVWNDTTIYYPSKFGVGFEYHPRNEWDTKFSIDAELIRWSEYDSLYDDVLEFSAGIEHIMHNGIPIRLGFRYQPSGQNKEITLIAFSTGTSIKLPHNFVLDIGTEIGKRNYSEMDLFPDGYYAHESLWDTTHNDLPEDRDEPDKVSDFMINAIATISWKF